MEIQASDMCALDDELCYGLQKTFITERKTGI